MVRITERDKALIVKCSVCRWLTTGRDVPRVEHLQRLRIDPQEQALVLQVQEHVPLLVGDAMFGSSVERADGAHDLLVAEAQMTA